MSDIFRDYSFAGQAEERKGTGEEMNLLATIEKLEELEKKATPGPWDNRCKALCNINPPRHVWSEYGWIADFFSPMNSAATDAEFTCSVRNSLPTLLTALREAIDLVETLEKVFEKYPIYARLNEETLEPIGNPCTEFLKKWTGKDEENAKASEKCL